MKTHLIRRQASSVSRILLRFRHMLALISVAVCSSSSLFGLASCVQINNSNHSKSVETSTISHNSRIVTNITTHSLLLPLTNANNKSSDSKSDQLVARTVSWKPRQSSNTLGGGYAVEVSPPPASMLFQYMPAGTKRDDAAKLEPSLSDQAPLSGSPFGPTRQPMRAIRMLATSAPPFAIGAVNYDDSDDEQNLLVTNACERNHMLAEIKTSKPFYGLIHTLGHQHKLICTVEGDGSLYYRLSIGYASNQSEPKHCGAIKLDSPDIEPSSLADEDTSQRLLSAVLAIRLHKEIGLPEYKIFAINCTRPDCPSSTQLAKGRLVGELSSQQSLNNWRLSGMESTGDDTSDSQQSRHHARLQLIKSSDGQRTGKISTEEICSFWSSAWLLISLSCLVLVLIGLLITNCLICCSLRANESGQDGKLAKRRSGGKLSPANNCKQVDKFDGLESEVDREVKLWQPSSKSKSKCIEYDNNNLSYSNYKNNDSYLRQERSHRYHDVSRQNNSSRTRNEHYR